MNSLIILFLLASPAFAGNNILPKQVNDPAIMDDLEFLYHRAVENQVVGNNIYTTFYSTNFGNFWANNGSGSISNSNTAYVLISTWSRLGVAMTGNPDNTFQVSNYVDFQDSNFSVYLGKGVGAKQGPNGLYTTGVGYQSLLAATSVQNSVAIGPNALGADLNGNQCIAIGRDALATNVASAYDIAIGYQALTLATGAHNLAIGASAGGSVTTGTSNVCIGDNSFGGTAGTRNTAIGYQSMTAGSGPNEASNTAVGASSLNNLSTGLRNSCLGDTCLQNITTEVNNVSMGYQAGANVTSSSNVFIGYAAGNYNGQFTETGGNIIVIGANVNAPSTTANNQLNIGNLIYGDMGANRVSIATTSPAATLDVYGNASFGSTSKSTFTTTGVLQLASALGAQYGGTGNVSNTASGVMVGEGTSAVNVLPAMGVLGIVAGNGTSVDPSTFVIKGTVNQVNVTTSATAITFSTPQDIASISSPIFGGLTINGTLTATAMNGLPAISSFTWGTGINISTANANGGIVSAGLINAPQFQTTAINIFPSSATINGSTFTFSAGSLLTISSITTTGRVGIVQASPGYSLDVGGLVKSTAIYVTGGVNLPGVAYSSASLKNVLSNATSGYVCFAGSTVTWMSNGNKARIKLSSDFSNGSLGSTNQLFVLYNGTFPAPEDSTHPAYRDDEAIALNVNPVSTNFVIIPTAGSQSICLAPNASAGTMTLGNNSVGEFSIEEF